MPEKDAYRSIHDLGPSVLPEVVLLRQKAPAFLDSLIESRIIPDIRTQKIAMGGTASACYFYENGNQAEVVKFGVRAIGAEAEALMKWKTVGASVVGVRYIGIVPMTVDDETPTQYVVLEGVVTQDGNPAPTGSGFLKISPDRNAELGTLMGTEIAQLHAATTDLPFGKFADIDGFNEQTVASYFGKQIVNAKAATEASGITTEQIEALQDVLQHISFPEKGSYVHGDYGPHNVLVMENEPLTIKIFDPTPSISDPYWDLARVAKDADLSQLMLIDDPLNEELRKRYQREKEFTEAYLDAYVEATGKPIDQQRLLANKIVVDLRSVQRQVTRRDQLLERTGNDTNHDPKVIAKKKLLQQNVQLLLKAA